MQKLKLFINALVFSGLLSISSYGLTAVPAPLKAKTVTWYQIEVLVYEPVRQSTAGETWPAISNDGIPASTIELAPVSIRNKSNKRVNAFQKLASATLNLSEIANKLRASRRYRVITLQGWQQPVKPRRKAKPVHLTSKQVTTINYETRQSEIQNNKIILNSLSQPEDKIPARIDGTVTVSLSRYLHMALKLRYYNTDVYLGEQIALQNMDEAMINTFMMKQSRRMRSKEIHAFDHPYFGVIATITPIQRAIRNKK